ncbi:ferredoxin [Alkalicoccobacillus murimartini]|uniref:Ferredoxin n=2 Tax=Alkalicoccobacillus murimartini TaxID=171685 RepID=A0ABT9YGE0_9BACI|nr:ferredoxin [Alkalicoccobacillus murimartini]
MRQKKNRSATMLEVCDHTGVEERVVRQFIREGRLIVSQFPNLGYPCESCGNMIQAKRICSSCQSELERELDSLDKPKKTERTVPTNQTTKQSQLKQYLQ